jgi:hypothetical protein
VARLDETDFGAAVISCPAELPVAGGVFGGQQDVIVGLEGAVVISFIMHPEITEASRDGMVRVAEMDGEVHIVLIGTQPVSRYLLLRFFEVIFYAYYAVIFGPLLERAYRVVHGEQSNSAVEQGDEIFLSLRRNLPGHIVEHDDVIVPVGDVFEYFALVILNGFDVLYVWQGVKHFQEWFVFEVVAPRDDGHFDFFVPGVERLPALQGDFAGANKQHQRQQGYEHKGMSYVIGSVLHFFSFSFFSVTSRLLARNQDITSTTIARVFALHA